MANDYIPRGDAEFNSWQANFVTYANANLVNLGLVIGDLTTILIAQLSWTPSLTAHIAAQANAQSARATKDGNRTTLESQIRALVRRLQASPSVSDAERAALGITVPDTGATAAASPTTRPVCEVDTSQRLRHTIDFTDEGTPTRKAKPAGVLGAEIWVKIGPTPPVDPSELTFLAVDTRSPYTRDYPGSEGGKQAHYMLRWVNTRGETGPWSETVTATIGA
ncbi:MAG: hypothetical protein KJ749_03650 [Planctomycetes bacterium]|nr:hypothetical protein [Planctomycetota bacterium]